MVDYHFHRGHEWTRWLEDRDDVVGITAAVLVMGMWLFTLYAIWNHLP